MGRSESGPKECCESGSCMVSRLRRDGCCDAVRPQSYSLSTSAWCLDRDEDDPTRQLAGQGSMAIPLVSGGEQRSAGICSLVVWGCRTIDTCGGFDGGMQHMPLTRGLSAASPILRRRHQPVSSNSIEIWRDLAAPSGATADG